MAAPGLTDRQHALVEAWDGPLGAGDPTDEAMAALNARLARWGEAPADRAELLAANRRFVDETTLEVGMGDDEGAV
jgi:hypothetical protein